MMRVRVMRMREQQRTIDNEYMQKFSRGSVEKSFYTTQKKKKQRAEKNLQQRLCSRELDKEYMLDERWRALDSEELFD